jgi:hypothetical protein
MRFLQKSRLPELDPKEHPSTTRKKTKALLEEREILTYFVPERSAAKQAVETDRLNGTKIHHHQKSSRGRNHRHGDSATGHSPKTEVQILITPLVEVPDSAGRRSISLPQRCSSRFSRSISCPEQIQRSMAPVPGGPGKGGKTPTSQQLQAGAGMAKSRKPTEEEDRRHGDARLEVVQNSTEILLGHSGNRKVGRASCPIDGAQHAGRLPPEFQSRAFVDQKFEQQLRLDKMVNAQASSGTPRHTLPLTQQWRLQDAASRSYQPEHEKAHDGRENEKWDTDSSSMVGLLQHCSQVQGQVENGVNSRPLQPITMATQIQPTLEAAGRRQLYPPDLPRVGPRISLQLPVYSWQDGQMYDWQTNPGAVSGIDELDQEPAAGVPLFPDSEYEYNTALGEPDMYAYEYEEFDDATQAYQPRETLLVDVLGQKKHSVEVPVRASIAPASVAQTRDRMAGFWRPHRLY